MGQNLHVGGFALHQATNAPNFNLDSSRMMEGIVAASNTNIIGNEEDDNEYVIDELAGTP